MEDPLRNRLMADVVRCQQQADVLRRRGTSHGDLIGAALNELAAQLATANLIALLRAAGGWG